jgi:hypothetical protein
VTPYLPSRRLTQDHRAEHIRETQDWQGQQWVHIHNKAWSEAQVTCTYWNTKWRGKR